MRHPSHDVANTIRQEFADVCDELLTADGDHLQLLDDNKLLGRTYEDTKRDAKDTRESARTLVRMSIPPLEKSKQEELARRAELVLASTSVVRGDKKLLDQMKSLHELLSEAALTSIIASRGGPMIVASLDSTRKSLLALVQARANKPEVAAAADRRDILDGMIVALARAAYAAARVASRRLGQPAIATAFKVDLLRPRRAGTPATDEPAPPALPEPPKAEEPGDAPITTLS
jgi:hypothetical protein